MEGQKEFDRPENTDTSEDAVEALTKKFGNNGTSVLLSRLKFRKRRQGNSETIDQYVSSLKDMAVACKYESSCDKMIRDQLIYGIKSNRIREFLLMESDGLTLSAAIIIATRVETTIEESRKTDEENGKYTMGSIAKAIPAIAQSIPKGYADLALKLVKSRL